MVEKNLFEPSLTIQELGSGENSCSNVILSILINHHMNQHF